MVKDTAVLKPLDASPRSGDVGSLLRGLKVFEALAASPDGASPQDLLRTTDLDRSTLQRLLRTLVTAGYAERLARGRYAIATQALSLGVRLTQSHHLGRVSRPYLLELQRDVDETVNLAVLDGTEVVYAARLATGQILSMNIDIGSRLPAYCTSLGRAILAYMPSDQARAVLERSDRQQFTPKTKTDIDELMAELERIRTRGFAYTEAELELGLHSVAAPVRGAGGVVLGAINVSVPAARVTGAELRKEMAPPLLRVADAFSVDLGWEREKGKG